MNCDWASLILRTDGYKPSHWLQYPPKTTNVYAHFMSRGGRFEETVFWGLQYPLMEYLSQPIVLEDIIEARELFADYYGNDKIFNEQGWSNLLVKHKGLMPVVVRAVPEGLPIPTQNVLMTVENTDPEFPWVTTYVEGLLSKVWYPTTVATLSRECKKVILKYLQETGTPELIDYKLHCFGYRGVSSEESASIGSAAHLLNFRGSDTIVALPFVRRYYGGKKIANSIPAAEHSTTTSWGRNGEAAAFENMLDKFPTGYVAVVSDSYDIYKACREIWGDKLKRKVLARDGVLVIRPDSGKPEVVVEQVLTILAECFGFEPNSKGYKVLNPKVRVIQGDGVGYDSISEILATIKKRGWSADNISFGMGGALLQKLDRDTQRFAYKCSSVIVDGEQRDVYKNPITDLGKQSMAGRLKLVRVIGPHGQAYRTLLQGTGFEDDAMQEVFRDGYVKKTYTFDECRANTERSVEYWR